MKKSEHIQGFTETIWTWFDHHKRELPWRDLRIEDDSQRAYQVLVSEVMLQQTQVSRVIVIYKRFLEQFPTLDHLAKASNKEVILAWRGMGYNSRALRLRDAAKTVVTEHKGVFPKEMVELESIKGIGHYTAAAVRNFAFNIPTACLDTNIRRIIHRVFIGPEDSEGKWKEGDKALLKLADDILVIALEDTSRSTADWHGALMDFGSLVCTKTNPKWDICPLTAKGLMKAAHKVKISKKKPTRKEPGRLVGSTYIPNRIFRGKVVEELRDQEGLTLNEIGERICIDWSVAEHKEWLNAILKKLVKDQLIREKGEMYQLH